MRRLAALFLPMLLLVGLVPSSGAAAAGPSVSGTLASKDKMALGPNAVALISIVDQQASGDAGSIVGSQRVDGATLPLAFVVPYDQADIDPGHSYAVFASIVDETRTLQSVEPVPVITGGPTSGLTVPLSPVGSSATATVTGTIARTDRTALSPAAAAYAALINEATGTMVARQAIPSPAQNPLPFSIRFDPGVVDPAAVYVVRAGIVDGGMQWSSIESVPAIVDGGIVPAVTVPVVVVAGAAPTPIPTATPKPTAKPTATPKPTAEPTLEPTPKPTAEPTATPEPTAEPTPEPTPEPTATPSPSPEPTSSATPEATAIASPSPTPSPDTGVIKGTLTYKEDHELSADARAVVLLIEGSGGPNEGNIVTSTSINDPGPIPVPFELAYPMSSVSSGAKYYLYAGIQDGDLAWVTPIGVSVKVPWPLTEDVELPLAFRPDLLKGAVSGTITGVGLDPARSPEAYGTALIVRVDTGETVGFQLVTPVGAVPIPFSVPYDPATIDPNADYVARGSVWDGTTLWTTSDGVPVITRGNAMANVVLTVTAVPAPEPTASPTPRPSPAIEPPPPADEGGGALPILLLLALVAVGGGVAALVLRNRKQAEAGDNSGPPAP